MEEGASASPPAPVSRRNLHKGDPRTHAEDPLAPISLVLGLSAILFLPTVGPLALLLSPLAWIVGQAQIFRARRRKLPPSGMARLGRNLGAVVAGPILLVAAIVMVLYGRWPF
jgi:hypothetical protein